MERLSALSAAVVTGLRNAVFYFIRLNFLRDVSEPYLRLFRRIIPPLGALDLSPMVAIIVLYVVRTVLVDVIS